MIAPTQCAFILPSVECRGMDTIQDCLFVPCVCKRDGGIMVSIAAFQAVDPGSIPGRRTFYVATELMLK